MSFVCTEALGTGGPYGHTSMPSIAVHQTTSLNAKDEPVAQPISQRKGFGQKGAGRKDIECSMVDRHHHHQIIINVTPAQRGSTPKQFLLCIQE
ncbi:hypothetical protein KEM48_009441 [Puccinia striiformis f. sp. tritici PST-130]|nr:hypothetical protein H4Q26_009834 [Puccinia striiformis f. sp. tritici PST-130]KAI9623546.1 hypothetical protein KEM48_009441 [Puccinia striiformis f. sp. tritici PST-130]